MRDLHRVSAMAAVIISVFLMLEIPLMVITILHALKPQVVTYITYQNDYATIQSLTIKGCVHLSVSETFHDCQQTPENENFNFAIFLQKPLRTT